ncbi:hypothetical protein V8E51_007661 [Hyaloscypha variabilis]|jgi:hypothetical protein
MDPNQVPDVTETENEELSDLDDAAILDTYPTHVPPQPVVADPLAVHIPHSNVPSRSVLDQDPINPVPHPEPAVQRSNYVLEENFQLPDSTPPVRTPLPDRRPTRAPAPAPAPPPAPAKKPRPNIILRVKKAETEPEPAKTKSAVRPKKPVVTKPVELPGTSEKKPSKIPKWGTAFPKTGFTPTGTINTSGTLKGHLSKEDCRGSPPAGFDQDKWEKKFRSAESVLMKQLKERMGLKEGKKVLDRMRDKGWVRDRAEYMLKNEKKKKEKDEAEEDLTPYLGDGEEDEEDEEMAEVDEAEEEEEEEEEEDEAEEDEEYIDEADRRMADGG